LWPSSESREKFGADFPLNEEMVSCEASAFSFSFARQVNENGEEQQGNESHDLQRTEFP